MTTERQIRLEQVRNQANVSLDVLIANNVVLIMPCSDLVTPLTATANVAYVNAPKAFTVTNVTASLLQASNGGNVTVMITGNGSNLLSTPLQVDNTMTSSLTSANAVNGAIANSTIVLDEIIKYSIIAAGANATGLIVKIQGYTNEAPGS